MVIISLGVKKSHRPVGLLNTEGYYDHLLAWMKKAVEEDFITEANFNDLIVSSSCENLVNLIIENQRPDNNDWTKRLGL